MPRRDRCPGTPSGVHHWREDVFDGRRKELVIRRTRRRFGRMVCLHCGAEYRESDVLKSGRGLAGFGQSPTGAVGVYIWLQPRVDS